MRHIFKWIVSLLMILCIYACVRKWETNVLMEIVGIELRSGIDLKVIVDDEIIYDDTLKINPLSFPTLTNCQLRMGYHDVSIQSKEADINKKVTLFLFYNRFIDIYISRNSENNKYYSFIFSGKEPFRYE